MSIRRYAALAGLLGPLLLAGCDVQVPSVMVLPKVLDGPTAPSAGGAAAQVPVASSGSLSGEAVIRPLAEAQAQAQGVPRNLIMAVAAQESGFNALAVSPVGAQGLMQLMPETVQDINRAGAVTVLDPFDAAQNLAGGTWYLKRMRAALPADKVQSGEEWKLALASYNGGIGRVGRAIDKALSGAPRNPRVRWEDISGEMPGETQRYVPAVMARWARYGVE
jgi:soluble lytic murein transglycosylase-like protein